MAAGVEEEEEELEGEGGGNTLTALYLLGALQREKLPHTKSGSYDLTH